MMLRSPALPLGHTSDVATPNSPPFIKFDGGEGLG